MELVTSRIDTLAQRIAERNLTERHRLRTQKEYETIFGIASSPDAGRANLDLIFRRVIQARTNPLDRDQYLEILNTVSPAEILANDSREAAFDALRDRPHIGQKIANEFLRHAVRVFEIRSEWIGDLAVALDTNVVQALVKTGAIRLNESERDRRPGEIINMDPDSNPSKLIGYQEVQNAFQDAADDVGFPRIVFDELWLEHRHFIANTLLQSESEFYDLIQDRYLYTPEAM